jgi:quercetin dioxygenase-like cupin family protein
MNNIEQYKEILISEGFPIIYEWYDQPGTIYEKHHHNGKVSFFVVEGSVTFSGGIQKTVSSGERINVPIGIEHSAVVGEHGCSYVVGQEIEDDA